MQDAKNRFSAVVNAALAGEPQQVTRRGKPAVIVIAVEDYERLRQAEQASGARFYGGASAPARRPQWRSPPRADPTGEQNWRARLYRLPPGHTQGRPDDLFERIPLKPRDVEF